MFGPAEATAADMVRRPGAKWWRSPAWTGMLTFHPSPSVEEHLFDLRCDCVFSSPHLQLPLDHALPPTSPSSGLSLINCWKLEKHSASWCCFVSHILCFFRHFSMGPKWFFWVIQWSQEMTFQTLTAPVPLCCWLLWKRASGGWGCVGLVG